MKIQKGGTVTVTKPSLGILRHAGDIKPQIRKYKGLVIGEKQKQPHLVSVILSGHPLAVTQSSECSKLQRISTSDSCKGDAWCRCGHKLKLKHHSAIASSVYLSSHI